MHRTAQGCVTVAGPSSAPAPAAVAGRLHRRGGPPGQPGQQRNGAPTPLPGTRTPGRWRTPRGRRRQRRRPGLAAGLGGLAQHFFDEEYMVHAGKYVIQAWLYRGRPEWSDEEFEEALGTGAMTVLLASPATLAEARRRFRQRMNANRIPGAGVN